MQGFEDPQKRSQENLINFLKIDLDLCSTMLETARITSTHEHFEDLQGVVSAALHTIRELSCNVRDRTTRGQIRNKADVIEQRLSGLRFRGD